MTETFKPHDHRVRIEDAGPWKLRITSYQLADKYVCTVDNVDPGRTIARVQAGTRDEAEAQALEQARRLVQTTRILQ
jgi:hypothetical protein